MISRTDSSWRNAWDFNSARDEEKLTSATMINGIKLPFFVAACDYTLIGEELYAASAYLSREPKLLGSLKASDLAKLVFGAIIVIGVILVNLGPGPRAWVVDKFRFAENQAAEGE